jgi:ATP-dependent RNA helicase DeaD
VVTALADEFDVMDIAAAAVKMAQAASEGEGGEEEIVAAPVPPERGGRERPSGGRERPSGGGAVRAGIARLFFAAGAKAGIRPGDLVGAIAGESGVPSSVIGAIRIAENFSVVEVPEDQADAIIAAVGAATVKGKKVKVRRDRDA